MGLMITHKIHFDIMNYAWTTMQKKYMTIVFYMLKLDLTKTDYGK